jgi:hypothetical protein
LPALDPPTPRGKTNNVDVAVLVIAVAVLSVGLPAAAVFWSRAHVWRRPVAPSWVDVLYAEARRHRLSQIQIEQVNQAVSRGAPAPTPLRSVTGDVAEAKVAFLKKARRITMRFRITVILLVGVGITVMTFRILAGHGPGTSWVPIAEGLVLGGFIRLASRSQLRKAQQAVLVNRDEPVSPDPP